MSDIVISGLRGFIGSRIKPIIEDAGLRVVSTEEFAMSHLPARAFVNLGNIANNPSENFYLIKKRIEAMNNKIDIWIQPQSFSTLIGRGSFSLEKYNCGFRPKVIDLYSGGKLMQEDALLRGCEASINLLYISAVLDYGSSWSLLSQKAKKSGYRLPAKRKAESRANFVYTTKIAEIILDIVNQKTVPKVMRCIANDPFSSTTQWEDILGQKKIEDTRYKSRFLDHAKSRVFRMSYDLGMFGSLTRCRPQRESDSHTIDDVGPVEFSSIYRQMIATQPALF